MWTIKYISANNFLSHKELEYKIVNNKLTMIYGQNKDVSLKKSNGSGKSVLLDVIAFSITGDCLRKIKSTKKIISNGEKECFAQIELENKVLKTTLKIRRTLSAKSSQKISIFLNDKECDELKDLHPKESDKFIEEQLGISFDDILNYYIISKFKYQSLFLANDATKKDVINRFSKADIVNDVFKHIDDDLNINQLNLQSLHNKLIKSTTTIELYEKQLEELVVSHSDERKKEDIAVIQNKIDQKNTFIKQLKSLIVELCEEISTIQLNINEKNKELIKDDELKKWDKTIDTTNLSLAAKRLEYAEVRLKYKNGFELLDKEEAGIKLLIKEYDANINEFNKSIKELESYIAGDIECPKCKHHFILADSNFNIEEAKENIKAFFVEKSKDENSLKEVTLFLGKVKQDRDQLNSEVSIDQRSLQFEADKIKEDLNKLESQKLQLTRSNNAILSTISEYELKIKNKELGIKLNDDKILNEQKYVEQYEEQIKEVQKNKNSEAIKQQNSKIETEVINKEALQLEIYSLTNKIAKINEWKNKFKRFKSYLANTAISRIQSQSNYFLKNMKSDLSVFVDGFRELSSGKLKEEITVEISRDGLEGEEFGAFSGGEKSVCDLSSILAMQNIINTTSHSGGLNILAIDEILESIDEVGMDDIAKCLSGLNQTILLIAHSQPSESIDCIKLLVEKKNGISKIVNNEFKAI